MKTKEVYQLFCTLAGGYLLAYSIIDSIFGKLINWRLDVIAFFTSFIVLWLAILLGDKK